MAVISPEEFQKKLDESKSQFIIKIDNDLKVFDARTEIINTRIKQAQAAVLEGKFAEVNELLSGVPDTIVAAERLRLLAVCEVHSESEFVYGADISKGQKYLDNILRLADEETVKTYQAIVKYNQENKNEAREIGIKIQEVLELVHIGSLDSAIKYLEQIANMAPTSSPVWCTFAHLMYEKYISEKDKTKKEIYMEKVLDCLIKQYQALSLLDGVRYREQLCKLLGNSPSWFWLACDAYIREVNFDYVEGIIDKLLDDEDSEGGGCLVALLCLPFTLALDLCIRVFKHIGKVGRGDYALKRKLKKKKKEAQLYIPKTMVGVKLK